jgi:hypothetical protein
MISQRAELSGETNKRMKIVVDFLKVGDYNITRTLLEKYPILGLLKRKEDLL